MKYLVQHFFDESLLALEDQIAVRQGATDYSYSEIRKRANAFACFLQSSGVKKGEIVAILSRVRVEAIAFMIAALRLGIVYAPLNIHAPTDWLGKIIGRSGVRRLYYDSLYEDKARELHSYGVDSWIDLSSVPVEAESFSLRDDNSILSDDLAYILYTSGSTGDPKGVMITHRNAWTFIDWMGEQFKVDAGDRVFSRAPLQFDLSVFDIFTTISRGATLIIADLDLDNRPETVVRLMNEQKVTVVYTVPSTYISWLSKGALDGGIPSLRLLLYAGEPFPPAYLRRLMQQLPGVWVSNIYGPTETNIVTYQHLFEPAVDDDPIPLGKPVWDTNIFIVDENLKLVPNGVVGEILVTGGTVFAGYLGDPELTAKKLIQSPFHAHAVRCCRTGDLGRILPDGRIAYHGRMDNMVKTRGYRVELDEVESAISQYEQVEEVAVVARPHEKYGNTLIAAVSLKGDASLELGRLKLYLASKLPTYMLPCDYLVMEELPKTATGKIDRVHLAGCIRWS